MYNIYFDFLNAHVFMCDDIGLTTASLIARLIAIAHLHRRPDVGVLGHFGLSENERNVSLHRRHTQIFIHSLSTITM